MGFPGDPAVKNLPANEGIPGFGPWVGKIPRRRKWQPTPVFLPGRLHGQRSLVGYSLLGLQRVRQDLVIKQRKLGYSAITNSPEKQHLCVVNHRHTFFVHAKSTLQFQANPPQLPRQAEGTVGPALATQCLCPQVTGVIHIPLVGATSVASPRRGTEQDPGEQ